MHSNRKSGGRECSHLAVGNAAESWERPDRHLTLTVGEVGSLGNTRAFAYESAVRGEIRCVRSGRHNVLPGVAGEDALSMSGSRSGLGSCSARACKQTRTFASGPWPGITAVVAR
jgi:hypothetical protein